MDQIENSSEAGQAAPIEMTPDEIRDAFRRYDLIIALGVVLMAFFAGSFLCDTPDLFRRIRTGELIAMQFPSMPTADAFEFSATKGAKAPNPEWLFDLLTYHLYRLGDVVLVGTKIAVLVLTVGLLLAVRYRGPTLGWHTFCVLLALVAMATWIDVGPQVFGYLLLTLLLLAWHQGTTRGPTWLVCLLVPISILWANIDLSFVLAPIVVTALCVGELFRRSGSGAADETIEVPRPGRGMLLAVLAGSWLAGLISPFFVSNVQHAWRWVVAISPRLPTLDIGGSGWGGILAFAEKNPKTLGGMDWAAAEAHVAEWFSTWSGGAWLLLVIVALLSLILNRRPLHVTRLLLFLVAVPMPFVAERWSAPSGLLLAYIASLNGQEFFLRRYGDAVRTGFWPMMMSQVTRMALILLVFCGLLGTLTGRVQGRLARFGFSVAGESYPLAGLRALESRPYSGRAFSIGPGQLVGASMQWAGPEKTILADMRWPTREGAWADYETARLSLVGRFESGGAATVTDDWKEIFEKWNITHVVLDARDESYMRRIRAAFAARRDFAPVYADDQCIVYGWLHVPSVDYSAIQKDRIRTNVEAFRVKREPPIPTEVSVTPPGIVFDRLWPWRFVDVPPGMIEGTFYSLGGAWLSEPGASILAAAHLRDSVSVAPNSPQANLRLGIAYLKLIQQEMSRLYADQASRLATTRLMPVERNRVGEDRTGQESSTTPNAGTVAMPEMPATQVVFRPATTTLTRHHQAMAALQNAMTAGADSIGAHQAMVELCQMNGYADMVLEHLEAISRLAESPEQRLAVGRQIQTAELEVNKRMALYRDGLATRMEQIRKDADRLDEEAAKLEQSAANEAEPQKSRQIEQAQMMRQRAAQGRLITDADLPLDNAMRAFDLNLMNLAVAEMEKVSPVSPQAVPFAEFAARLYLLVGRPERALERLQVLRDSGQSQPGIYSWLYAQYLITMGRFQDAANSLESAIAEQRHARLASSLALFDPRVRTGELATRSVPGLVFAANRLVTDVAAEASFYYDLAMVHIELCQPDRALKDFAHILELAPNPRLWPVMDFYQQAIVGNSADPLERGEDWTPEDDVVERFEPPQPIATPDPASRPDAKVELETAPEPEAEKAESEPKAESPPEAEAEPEAESASA